MWKTLLRFCEPLKWVHVSSDIFKNLTRHFHDRILLRITGSVNESHIHHLKPNVAHCSLSLSVFYTILMYVYLYLNHTRSYILQCNLLWHCSELYHPVPWASSSCNPNDGEWQDCVGECNRGGRLWGVDWRALGTCAAVLFFFFFFYKLIDWI